jgi:hypothetical protein
MPIRPKTGGPIMRPTQVTLMGAGSAIPSLPNGWLTPPITSEVASAPKSAQRVWLMTYSSAAKNQIATYKDPAGLTTAFTYAEGSMDYPFGPAYATDSNYGTNYPIKFMRVASATTTGGGLAAGQSWAWSQGSNTVTHTSTFNGAAQTTTTDYTSAKPMDIVNGVWATRNTYDGPSASGAPIATMTNNSTSEAGLDGTLTAVSSQTITKNGEPSFTIDTSAFAGTYGLRAGQTTVRDSSGGEVQRTDYTYGAPNWARLE